MRFVKNGVRVHGVCVVSAVETLEDRALFSAAVDSAGVLHIVGTAGNDRIVVNEDSGIMAVSVNGETAAIPVAPVKAMSIEGLGGNDDIQLDKNITSGTNGLPTTINGGDGNDKISLGWIFNTMNGIRGPVSIDGGAGSDEVHFLDNFVVPGAAAPTYSFAGSTFRRTPFTGTITYRNAESLVLHTSDANAQVNGATDGTPVTVQTIGKDGVSSRVINFPASTTVEPSASTTSDDNTPVVTSTNTHKVHRHGHRARHHVLHALLGARRP